MGISVILGPDVDDFEERTDELVETLFQVDLT